MNSSTGNVMVRDLYSSRLDAGARYSGERRMALRGLQSRGKVSNARSPVAGRRRAPRSECGDDETGSAPPPRLKDTEKTDLRSQVLRVAGDGGQRLACRTEEYVEDDLFVIERDSGQFLRNGENDMEVLTRGAAHS